MGSKSRAPCWKKLPSQKGSAWPTPRSRPNSRTRRATATSSIAIPCDSKSVMSSSVRRPDAFPHCPSSLFVRDWTLGPDCPRAHAGERGQRAREGSEDELLGDQPSNASDQADSGCLSPLVSMVQSTDSRQRDYFRRRRRGRCVTVLKLGVSLFSPKWQRSS